MQVADRGARRKWLVAGFDLVLFSYLLWFRTHGIAETFWLHADQERDWRIALRPFTELPLVGPPSVAGGNTAGPVYYWILWMIARTIGPWCDLLPHAGGIGISLLQSAGDVVLFHGLWRRLSSAPIAFAIVLIVATSGPEATISATIWNPPVAIALMKTGLALVMLTGVRSGGSLVATTAIFWLAVQAHTTVLPVAMSVLIWAAMSTPTWHHATGRVLLSSLVIAVLQVPWLIDRVRGSGLSGDTALDRSILAALTDPIGTLRPVESALALIRGLNQNLQLEISGYLLAAGVIAGAASLLLLLRDSLISVVAVGSLICTVAIFAVWQGALAENYWYLPSVPAATLCLVGWMSATRGTAQRVLVSALLAAILATQPAHARYAWTSLRSPLYGILVRASRSLRQSEVSVHAITTTFPLPSGTDAGFLYSILGGRLVPTVTARAVVSLSGRVSFESAAVP